MYDGSSEFLAGIFAVGGLSLGGLFADERADRPGVAGDPEFGPYRRAPRRGSEPSEFVMPHAFPVSRAPAGYFVRPRSVVFLLQFPAGRSRWTSTAVALHR